MLSPLHPMSVDVSQPGEDWKISSVPLSVLYFCSWKEWQLFRYKVVSVQGHMLRHFWSGYGFHLFSSPGDNSYWEPHIVPSILLYPRYIIRCMKWTENSSLHLIWKWTVCDIVSTTSVPGLIIQLITCTHSSCHARQGCMVIMHACRVYAHSNGKWSVHFTPLQKLQKCTCRKMQNRADTPGPHPAARSTHWVGSSNPWAGIYSHNESCPSSISCCRPSGSPKIVLECQEMLYSSSGCVPGMQSEWRIWQINPPPTLCTINAFE